MAQTDETRIFLVEDQTLTREGLAALIEIEPNMRIVGTAAQAEKALLRLETLEADVVLMDVGLPGMSGIEAARVLRGKTPQIPVVMLTSYGDTYREDAFDAGASGYMKKSCTREELVSTIREAHAGNPPIDGPDREGPDREQPGVTRADPMQGITFRQLKILRLIAKGAHYSEIARALDVSEATVQRDAQRLFKRLGAASASHAVYEAAKLDLL